MNSFERMNVNGGNWEPLLTFGTSRFGHISWADPKNNKIYIACGATDISKSTPINSVEVYDVANPGWTTSQSKFLVFSTSNL